MEMGWDDTIQEDGQELVLLDGGDYNFTVTNFERGRFPGGQKIPACNKAWHPPCFGVFSLKKYLKIVDKISSI